MKTLFAVLFLAAFQFAAFAEWNENSHEMKGKVIYVKETVKKFSHDGREATFIIVEKIRENPEKRKEYYYDQRVQNEWKSNTRSDKDCFRFEDVKWQSEDLRRKHENHDERLGWLCR